MSAVRKWWCDARACLPFPDGTTKEVNKTTSNLSPLAFLHSFVTCFPTADKPPPDKKKKNRRVTGSKIALREERTDRYIQLADKVYSRTTSTAKNVANRPLDQSERFGRKRQESKLKKKEEREENSVSRGKQESVTQAQHNRTRDTAPYESQIGPYAGTPRLSISYTTISTTFLFEMMLMASAPVSLYTL